MKSGRPLPSSRNPAARNRGNPPAPGGLITREAVPLLPGKTHAALPLAFFLFLVLALLRKMTDFDIWYHLVIGRKILETMAIPRTEFIVHPHWGTPVLFHEWGFGAIYYAVYRTLGYVGMSMTNALVGAGTLFLLIKAARGQPGGVPARVLAALALVPFVEFRIVYRPETFLFLSLAAEILLLEGFTEEGDVRWLVPLPFLAFLLSNVHPSALLLVIVAVFYAADLLLGSRARRPGRMSGCLLLLAAATFLGGALNPYGFRQVILPVFFGSQDEVLKRIVEFLPAWQTEYRWHFVSLAVVGMASLLYTPGKRLVDWLLFAVFGYMAFRHVRNIPLLAIALFTPFAGAVGRLVSRFSPPEGEGSVRRILLPGAALIACAAVFLIPVSEGRWGAGPDKRTIPVESAEVIRAVRPNGSLLNFYEMGGYLAWALYGEYPVFIDGRHYERDTSWVHHDEIMSAGSSADKLLADYRVAAVATRATFPYSGRIIPLVPKLAADPAWLLARQEEGGLLFLRRSALNDPARVPPLDAQLVWRQVIRETARTLGDYPARAAAWRSRGDAFFMLNDKAGAAEAYGRVLSLDPDHADSAILRRVIEACRTGREVSR